MHLFLNGGGDGAVKVLGNRLYYVFVNGESCVGKDDIV